MGLRESIKTAQSRKAVQVIVQTAKGDAQLAAAIVTSKDGGLLAHVKAEATR